MANRPNRARKALENCLLEDEAAQKAAGNTSPAPSPLNNATPPPGTVVTAAEKELAVENEPIDVEGHVKVEYFAGTEGSTLSTLCAEKKEVQRMSF